MGDDAMRDAAMGEWAVLAEWQRSPVSLVGVDLAVLRGRLRLVGRARASLAAFEADLVGEIARQEGEAEAEEILRRDQKRSLAGARKAVKVAAQLEWMPGVAEKLAEGAITAEAASLIAEAAAETPVDQNFLLDAAEQQADDLFRRTLKKHINERTNDEELQARRERQRRRRRASISEEPDGMFNLFARLDPLAGARLRGALFAKTDELFRAEDPQQRATPQQRLADALEQLACHPNTNTTGGRPPDAELVVLADYDTVHDKLVNAGLVNGTRLTETETLAIACDAKILPGIFNKHTGNIILGQTRRKVSRRLRKRLTIRDRGCIGCGAPHKICEVHHIEHWQNGGPTTYDNTCLLCWRCHHIRVHHHGEQITRHPNGHYTLQPPVDAPPRAGPPTARAGPPNPPHTEQASPHTNGHHTPQPPVDAPPRAGPPHAEQASPPDPGPPTPPDPATRHAPPTPPDPATRHARHTVNPGSATAEGAFASPLSANPCRGAANAVESEHTRSAADDTPDRMHWPDSRRDGRWGTRHKTVDPGLRRDDGAVLET